ncbi:hypothetical protein JOC85_003332 [Bacillus mesophilus]|uniref:L,D-transpeptidase family protein n=1 Tax=Bacillus mesophilus TaxID=1808955 RepID=A0A6M0Q935_9BACI|nr:triple tyrosine motif-containing protein [Bacillus mesophilus]MBM7662525.1 hypothetical protein [Bacillus mesophilus]NEY72852.1 L,D-transpeptidase family protein [Bacillus mesophilus]
MKKLTGAFIVLMSLFLGTSMIEAETGNQLIIINKGTNQLAFFENGKHVATFRVATGRSQSYTPEGTFQIVNKIKNRPYYKENIPGGHPNNPLGDRWLGLDARGTYGTTYAIHGNSNPASIGTYASAGCVRMFDDDVRWLFDRVDLYATVVITNTSQSFEAIAVSKNYTPYSKLKSVSVDQKSPQPLQTNIVVSAKANLKSTYRFLVQDGGEWKTVQDFSTSSSFTWKPEKAGSYKIKVQAKSTSSDKAFDDEKVITYDVYTPASIETFDSEKEGPLPNHSEIAFSTTTNSDTENLVQYSLYNGSEWTVLKDYSDEGLYNWKPENAGTYKIRTRVKHSLSQQDFDEEQELEYTIFEPATLTSLNADVTSPQPIHSSIIVKAESKDDSTNLFKFQVFEKGSWNTVQEYSTKSSLNWNPNKAGDYQVKVLVKHTLSKEDFDSEKVVDFTIYEPATVGDLTTNVKGIQLVKSKVELSATKAEDVEYQFSVFDGNDWKVLQSYSTSHELEWSPSSPGIYKVKIEVKHNLSVDEYDDLREVSYIFYNSTMNQAVLPSSVQVGRRGPFLVKKTAI